MYCVCVYIAFLFEISLNHMIFLLRFGAKWYILKYKTVNWKAWRVNNCALCKVCVTGNSSKDAHVLTRRDSPKYILYIYFHVIIKFRIRNKVFFIAMKCINFATCLKARKGILYLVNRYLYTEHFLMNCVRLLVVTE